MIIDNLDIVGIVIDPSETNAPLIVDPNAHLPGALVLEPFEPVPRRVPEVLNRARCVQLAQLPQSPILDIRWEPPAGLSPPDPFRLLIPE
jgi:hypothetical protein